MLSKGIGGSSCLLIVLSLAQPACAGPKFADFPVRKASDCAVKAEKDGFVIGVQPLEDVNDQKTYFGLAMTPRGFIPVFIVLESATSEDSLLFDKSGVKIGQAGWGDSNPRTSMGAGKTAAIDGVAVASAFFVPLAGALFAMAAFNNADAVRQNILKEELQSGTISPGKSLHGFLYIPAPKNGPRGKIRLQIPIVRAGTDESFALDVTF